MPSTKELLITEADELARLGAGAQLRILADVLSGKRTDRSEDSIINAVSIRVVENPGQYLDDTYGTDGLTAAERAQWVQRFEKLGALLNAHLQNPNRTPSLNISVAPLPLKDRLMEQAEYLGEYYRISSLQMLGKVLAGFTGQTEKHAIAEATETLNDPAKALLYHHPHQTSPHQYDVNTLAELKGLLDDYKTEIGYSSALTEPPEESGRGKIVNTPSPEMLERIRHSEKLSSRHRRSGRHPSR
jgi:hypothetical protein